MALGPRRSLTSKLGVGFLTGLFTLSQNPCSRGLPHLRLRLSPTNLLDPSCQRGWLDLQPCAPVLCSRASRQQSRAPRLTCQVPLGVTAFPPTCAFGHVSPLSPAHVLLTALRPSS